MLICEGVVIGFEGRAYRRLPLPRFLPDFDCTSMDVCVVGVRVAVVVYFWVVGSGLLRLGSGSGEVWWVKCGLVVIAFCLGLLRVGGEVVGGE